MLNWIKRDIKNTLGVSLSGEISAEDVRVLSACLEEMIEKHGKVRLLIEFREVDHIKAGALWEDLKFDARHYRDIGRLAIVGDSKWQKWLTSLAVPFASDDARFFHAAQISDAWEWLESGTLLGEKKSA